MSATSSDDSCNKLIIIIKLEMLKTGGSYDDSQKG